MRGRWSLPANRTRRRLLSESLHDGVPVRGAAIEDGKKEEIEMPFESFAAHTL
jgi:hypothetical protein